MPPKRVPTTLFQVVRPDPESAALLISSDILVMMLRIVEALRALLLAPAISESAGSKEIRDAVQDLEHRIAATMMAINELAEDRGARKMTGEPEEAVRAVSRRIPCVCCAAGGMAAIMAACHRTSTRA